MIQKIRTEMVYYLIILVLLALLQHSDLIFAPLERFAQMQSHANYLHPFLYAFIVYGVIGLFRATAKFILFLKGKFVK
jgi:hypothetical protein